MKRGPLTTVVVAAGLLACHRGDAVSKAAVGAAAATSEVPRSPPTKPIDTATATPLTTDQIRSFVVETHLTFTKMVDDAYAKLGRHPKPSGSCSDGEPALLLVKAKDAMPAFEKRLEGRALRCYVATFFRCKVDGWLSHAANLVNIGPANVPFRESKVVIVEQSATRVVADVQEAEPTDVGSDGRIDRENVPNLNFERNTRYTFHRDAKGTWRIADRVTPEVPMDCQQY